MPSRLLKRFLETLCRHVFSWPHSGDHGRDYQVCVRCGAMYEYDWDAMRRTRRAGSVPTAHAESKNEHRQRA
jgi:hypothetical protein